MVVFTTDVLFDFFFFLTSGALVSPPLLAVAIALPIAFTSLLATSSISSSASPLLLAAAIALLPSFAAFPAAASPLGSLTSPSLPTSSPITSLVSPSPLVAAASSSVQ